VLEVTSGRKMADRHLRNQSITIVEENIGRRGSNEVDIIGNPENAAVNRETEAEETGIPECEGNHSDSRVANEVGVCGSARQLQDLITNAISALRTDIVEIIEKNK